MGDLQLGGVRAQLVHGEPHLVGAGIAVRVRVRVRVSARVRATVRAKVRMSVELTSTYGTVGAAPSSFDRHSACLGAQWRVSGRTTGRGTS